VRDFFDIGIPAKLVERFFDSFNKHTGSARLPMKEFLTGTVWFITFFCEAIFILHLDSLLKGHTGRKRSLYVLHRFYYYFANLRLGYAYVLVLLDVYDINSTGFISRESMTETIEHDLLISDCIQAEKMLNQIFGPPDGKPQQISYEQLLTWVKQNREITALTLWITEPTKKIEGPYISFLQLFFEFV
jgi:hypothetical protein